MEMENQGSSISVFFFYLLPPRVFTNILNALYVDVFFFRISAKNWSNKLRKLKYEAI